MTHCIRDKVDCSKFCAGQCDPFGASCWYEENKPRPQPEEDPEEKPHRQPSMVLIAVVVALFWVAIAVGVKLALKGGGP